MRTVTELHLNVRGPIGTAGSPVVALHGLSGAGSSFVPLLMAGARGHRSWAPDLRGHGESSHDTGGYALAGYVSDAARVLASIGEPTIVVGHSLGAVVAAALAQDRHPLVKAVFLEDPPLFVLDPGSFAATSFAAGFTVLEEAVRGLHAEGAPLATYEALFAAAPHPAGGTNAERVLADARTSRSVALRNMDPDAIRAVLDGRTFAGYDPDRPLWVPTLVLRAGERCDPAFRPDDVDRLQACSPHARVVEVPGTGHNIRGDVAGRERYVELLQLFLHQHG
jgi:pimeloyl-ACP methyl ester carboxylesterase